jgi:hypothetical protein
MVVLFSIVLSPATAWAGNTDDVNAGLDVTLTGGAVVANVYTGASHPAGIARSDKPTLELAGVTLNMQIVKNPGLLTIETDPPQKSEGSSFNFTVIPQALTFTIVIKENLKLGVGLFNSSIRREFITEEVASPTGTTPLVESYAGRNSRLNFFHVSSGLAGEFGKKQKVLFGGAFDIVIATARVDDSYTVFYNSGVAGQVSSGEVRNQTGFGFQLKSGIRTSLPCSNDMRPITTRRPAPYQPTRFLRAVNSSLKGPSPKEAEWAGGASILATFVSGSPT